MKRTVKIKLDAKTVAHLAPARRKCTPRGSSSHPAWKANQFPKGKSGNPGGKPKVLQKFATKVAEELSKPAPKELRKPLKLKNGATMFDAMMSAAVMQAAQGDLGAFVVMRETLEGKLPQRNYNLSVSMQAYMDDPEFAKFLDAQHAEYRKQIGEPYAPGATTEDLRSLLTGQEPDSGTGHSQDTE